MKPQTLAERLGGIGNGLEIFTCKECGSHTAGKPPVKCWMCSSKSDEQVDVVFVQKETPK